METGTCEKKNRDVLVRSLPHSKVVRSEPRDAGGDADVPCDGTGEFHCPERDTCCKISATEWACCPSPRVRSHSPAHIHPHMSASRAPGRELASQGCGSCDQSHVFCDPLRFFCCSFIRLNTFKCRVLQRVRYELNQYNRWKYAVWARPALTPLIGGQLLHH